MYRRGIRIILFLFLCFSCQSQQEKQGNESLQEIDIDSLEKVCEGKSPFIKKEFIPLETTNGSILSGVNKIRTNKILFVIEDSSENLFVFNKQGKFMYRLGEKGMAKNEYIHLLDFYIDDARKEIVLIDNIKCKSIHYDYNGAFLATVSFPDDTFNSCSGVTYIKEGCLLLKQNNETESPYNFSIFSTKQNKKEGILPFLFSSNQPIDLSRESKSTYNGKDMFVITDLSDTIYTLSPHRVAPKYVFCGHSRHIDAMVINDDKQGDYFSFISNIKKDGISLGIQNIYATKSHLFFSISDHDTPYWVCYNYLKGKGCLLKFTDPILMNIKGSYDNILVSCIDAECYKELIEKGEYNNSDQLTTKEVSEEDNPIIILLHAE